MQPQMPGGTRDSSSQPATCLEAWGQGLTPHDPDTSSKGHCRAFRSRVSVGSLSQVARVQVCLKGTETPPAAFQKLTL